MCRYDIAAKATTRIRATNGGFENAPSVTRAGIVYSMHSGHGRGASATLARQRLGGSDTVLVTFK